MKKALLMETARMLYIEKGYTYEQIAAELDVSERTARAWGKEGGWPEKMQTITAARERMSEQVQETTSLLGQILIGQLTEGKEPNSRVLDAYARLASSLIKAREYDKDIEAEQTPDKSNDADALKHTIAIFEDTFKEKFPGK
ncbi:MAG: hypothetical protein RR555_05500 [Bacteroidales bacterium]